MEKIIAYTDGKARGNPGPSAVGVYIVTEAGELVREIKQSIGNAYNDFAEYYAVLLALQTLEVIYSNTTKTKQFEIRLDSELVKQQLNAESQIKAPGLVPMFIEIHNMRVASFPNLIFTLVPHEENQEAARLVSEVLDV